jgi:signal transduction histidine kinase
MAYNKNSIILKRLPVLVRARAFSACFIALAGLLLFSCSKPSITPPTNSDYNKVLDSANYLYDKDKYEPAVLYLDAATTRYKDLNPHQKFLYYEFKCNYFFHYKKDNNKAMLYADSMVNLFDTPEKKLKYVHDYGFAHFSKGDVLFAENKYNEAYRYFYQGKLIAKKDINNCTLSDYSYRMGMIMYQQGHFRLAAANFVSSLKETGACDMNFRSFYRGQELMDNIGLSYVKINEPDSALAFYSQGLNFINKWAGKFNERANLEDVARAVIYGNEADIYIKESKFQVAKKLLKKSIEINLKKGNDNHDAGLSELKLAHIYFSINEPDSAVTLLRLIRPQLDNINDAEADTDWNLLMANYFIKNNDTKTALNYFIKYDALKDTVVKRNKGLKEADIAEQINRLEKENEFDTLKKDSQQQYLYLKIIMVFGLMLLIIFLLILLNWRKSKRNIKILGALNQQINYQNNNLENTLNELKLSSQEKDRILRTVAHDLRNPIGGIASLTAAMTDDGFTAEQMEMINLIKETSNNSLELINEILEVTNNGASLLNKELVEINSLLNNSVELLRFKAAEKGQEIKLGLLNKPVELFISKEKIWRVISNLISNAIKFSPAGALIFVNITEQDKYVTIAVKDNGIGIPQKIKDKVFNVFTEAKRPGTAGEKSFGLGLSISKQIIESHNGDIWLESSAESGTIFYVKLPKGS